MGLGMAPSAYGAPPPDTPTLVLQTVGLDEGEFMEALQLRLPDQPMVGIEAPRPEGVVVHVVVRIEPPGSDEIEITLVDQHGRAWERRLDDEPDQAVRVASNAVATLWTSVERGLVMADRLDGFNSESTSKGSTPATTSMQAKPPETMAATSPAPASALDDGVRTEHDLDVGVVLGGAAGFGIAPPVDAPVFTGAGGSLGLVVGRPHGGFAELGTRVLYQSRDQLQATRVRVALGGGYCWSWKRFELPVQGSATVESWWIRQGGEPAQLRSNGQSPPRTPLIGVTVAVAPSVVLRPSRGSWRVRIGPAVELAGSFLPSQGARTLRLDVVSPATRNAVFRMGGLELELGARLSVLFGVSLPKRPSTNGTPP